MNALQNVRTNGNGATKPAPAAVSAMDEIKAMRAELEAMKAENAALRAAPKAAVVRRSPKISAEKGVVCGYHTTHRPVALYASQWVALADNLLPLYRLIASSPTGMACKDGTRAATVAAASQIVAMLETAGLEG